MSRTMNLRLLAAALLALCFGCTRVVDLGIDEGPVRLVIEGRIELIKGDAIGRQHIRLSTTDGFATAGYPPAVKGATVTVTDDQGRVFNFAESATESGTYVTTGLVPTLGGRYTLAVRFRGDRYTATDQVQPVSPIDSLYFVYQDQSAIRSDPGFRSLIDYTDPPGKGNYYLWEMIVNDSLRLSRDPGNRFRVISEDRFYDGGRVVGYLPFDEEVVETGQLVLMRQLALSEASYRYYAALFEQSTGGGSPFSTPPASVRGNGANLDNPSLYPLGYFLAADVSERRAIVPAR
jgi:hypothetical protein